MIMTDREFTFNFLKGQSLDSLKSYRHVQDFVKVCYITTKVYRMYLCIRNGFLIYTAFVRKNNQWRSVPVLKRTPSPSTLSLASEANLENDLARVFSIQFPKAYESYWEDLPSFDEVMSRLRQSLYETELKQYHYRFVNDGHVEVDDADGITTIFCSEGQIMVPFDYVLHNNIPDLKYQVDRALEHPDSSILSFYSKKVYQWILSYMPRHSTPLWIRFREFVNSKVRQYKGGLLK